jgi:hypothetical protein
MIQAPLYALNKYLNDMYIKVGQQLLLFQVPKPNFGQTRVWVHP